MVFPFQLSLLTLVLASSIVLAAAFVQSLTGFGFALVSVPILILILDPRAIVPISLILGTGLNLLALGANSLAGNKKKGSSEKLNWWLLAGALLGIPFGSYMLGLFNPNSLRLLVGVTGVVSGITIARGYTWHIRRPHLLAMAVGILSGALNSSTSMGGGPVALFLTHQRSDKNDFRTHLLLYILLANLIAILALVATGLLAISTLWLSLWLTPAMLVGFGLGNWLFHRLSAPRFTQIVVGAVVLTSAIGVLIALIEYLKLAVVL